MKRAFKSEAKAEFFPVDVEALPIDLQRKLSAYRKAEAEARNHKVSFESAIIAAGRKSKKLDPHETYAFGYKFGGFAMAVVNLDDKPKAPAKAKINPFA
jgi:hypothetical protein